jgi:hypothetical protein
MRKMTVLVVGGITAMVMLVDLPSREASAISPQTIASTSVGAGRAVVNAAVGQRRSDRKKSRRMTYKVVEVTDSGTIEGVVLYKGRVPPPKTIQIVKDQEVCDHRPKTVPAIEINDQHQVAEAVVFLGDIKAGKAPPEAAAKPRIDQKHCRFEPHVQVMLNRQPFDVTNSDPVLHNIQATQGFRELFNVAQPRQGSSFENKITKGGLVKLQCQAHQWMRAYVYVLWHPYYHVTGDDGAFKLTDVPAGEYELVVWQETLGEQSQTVQVESGKTARIECLLEPAK